MKAKTKSSRQVGNVHFHASVDAPLSSKNLAQVLLEIRRGIIDAGVSILPNDEFDIEFDIYVRFIYIPDENV